jgi:hypothetical protein
MGMRGPQNYVFRLNALVWWTIAICAIATPAYAATITVTNTNDSGLGSLRHALAIANDGDAITIAVTGSIVLTTGELLVNKSVIISGPRAGNLVVDGNASSRVFHIASDQSVSIAGLTVRNGIATTNDGGGIYNDHAALTLNDCTITGNVAGYGGGIYNDGSLHGSATLEINSCTIRGNSATHTGGGIYNNGSSNGIASLTISSSTLSDNSARLGGGIYNDGFDIGGDAILTVTNSSFGANSADFGGCVFNDGSSLGNASLTFNDTTLSGNTAHTAGGSIYNEMVNGFGTQTLNNSNLHDNSAGKSGGAIYNDQGESFTINNCAISRNSAQKDGGGIYNDGYQGVASLAVNSSTLNGNSASAGGGIFNDGRQRGVTRLQISNSTFSENTASYGGGLASNGFDAYYVRVTIGNSTFSSNSASSAGGGIYNVGQRGQDTVLVTVDNTILNNGPLGSNIFCNSDTILSLGYNLANDSCGNFLTSPGDQTNTDPMLGPLQDNGGSTLTHALLPGSPAINAGDPSFTQPPLYDQRGPGFDRVMNGRIDIGSFEVQESTPGQTPRPIPPRRPRPAALPRPTPR